MKILFPNRKQVLLLVTFSIFMLLLLHMITSNRHNMKNSKIITSLIKWATEKMKNSKGIKEIECFYSDSQNNLDELDDFEPTLGNGIFFHETSCPKNISDINLSFRQACSVESALVAHPKNEVFLLISSPIKLKASETQNVLIKELLSYSNFKIRHINFERHLSNTPMRKLYESEALSESEWPSVHASDILRYTTLYKFGGVYLDIDVIVLKSLSNLTNYAGIQTDNYINSAVMNFSNDSIGEEMRTACAEEITKTFNGKIWIKNGPGVIMRVLEKRCNMSKFSEMNEERCKGFHVYPPSYFYPIDYQSHGIIFESGKTELVERLINNSYALHFWNKLSAKSDLNKPDIPLMKLAKKYCPKVFQANHN